MAAPTKKTTTASATKSAAKTTVNSANDVAETHGETAFAMGDAARNQYDSFLQSFNSHAEELQGRTQEMMEAAREGYEAAQTTIKNVSAEAMEAARQEMTDAVDFANEIARAKTIADALEIQRDYATRTFETRVERMRAMTQSTVDMMRDSVEPMNRSMSRVMAAAPAMTAFTAFFPNSSK